MSDKLWDMQRTRILDKVQRLLDVNRKKMELIHALFANVQARVDRLRAAGGMEFTREDAALYMDTLTVFSVEDGAMKELEKRWIENKKEK